MKILLDTCVISELKKLNPNRAVDAFVSGFSSADTYVSVITIGELFKGVFLLPFGRKRKELELWILELEKVYAHNVLNVSRHSVFMWAKLTAQAQQEGKIVSVPDGLIAATAIEHGLTVITRNVKDFEHTGAIVHNPWE